jgi:glucose/arabinose dehydrogenase
MKLSFSYILGVAVFFLGPRVIAQTYVAEPAFPTNPVFKQPVGIVCLGGRDPNLPVQYFVIEKVGRIQLVSKNSYNKTPRTIFDISQPKDGEFYYESECGLLGFAFHPDFKNNGQVFVYYSLKIKSKLHQRVSRFIIPDQGTMKVDMSSEVPLISQEDPADNHNGGDLHFGPDGYLYISTGDGGWADDYFDNAGHIDKGFFGAIYRIDVDRRTSNLEPNPHPAVHRDSKGRAYYSIPADNPFLGIQKVRGVNLASSEKVRTETWAFGLRNPWRFCFHPRDGRLFTGDVGQNLFEEIDIIIPGGDYGWSEREGFHPFRKSATAKLKQVQSIQTASDFVSPIYEYPHPEGHSVTGGVFYLGDRSPSLKGAYLFADYSSGWIKALREEGGRWSAETLLKDEFITGFGVDPANSDVLFVSFSSGQVKRILQKSP